MTSPRFPSAPGLMLSAVWTILPSTLAVAAELSAAELGRSVSAISVLQWHGDGARISPDGEWVVYAVKVRSLSENTAVTEWRLQRVHDAGGRRQPHAVLPVKGTTPRWHPDSKRFSLVPASETTDGAETSSLILYDVLTGQHEPIRVEEVNGRFKIGANYAWSPDGRRLAFVATVPGAAEPKLDHARGTPYETWVRQAIKPTALYILDLESGEVRRLTPDSLHPIPSSLSRISWSPDGQELAVAVDRQPDSSGMFRDTDLLIVDAQKGHVRSLIARPGKDNWPLWSPDGRWIAFTTTHERDEYRGAWPAVVAAKGGEVIALGGAQKSTVESWSADSKSFFIKIHAESTTRLVRADIAQRSVSEPLPVATGGPPLPGDDVCTFSANGTRIAFVRSALTKPPELFVADLDTRGVPRHPARQLTDIVPDFALEHLVRTEMVSWPSPDGKFVIQGILLTPLSAWKEGKLNGPLPTLLYLTSGPTMVQRGFTYEGSGEIRLPLAARGYAVLVPNTRGRNGQGDAFQDAISDGKSNARLPYQDAVAGIDLLIERGIADPNRLGVLGHSYGGFLASYTVTQTERFKAAAVHEPGDLVLTPYIHWTEKGTWRELLARDLFGVHDPFDPVEQRRLFDESPMLNANLIKTPTLLTCGAKSVAELYCRPLFTGIRRFGVPSAMFVYDEGHGFERPAAIADHITRTIEWFDYWVRGIPYPDPSRAREYDAWRTADGDNAS